MNHRTIGLHVVLFGVVSLSGCGGDDVPTTDAGRDLGGDVDGGARDAGDTDAGDTDAGSTDAGASDAARVDAGAVDAGDVDAGPLCGGNAPGSCALVPGTSCLSCPAGGPVENYLCTTACNTDANCTDAARPRCNRPSTSGTGGICTSAEFSCAWGAVCASPDTMVATPEGERPISELRTGDLVLSIDEGVLRIVPIRATQRIPVTGHHVVRITLSSGRVVEMSEGHPTAEGVPFRMLTLGTRLGEATVSALELVPYAFDATYDILPGSDTGTYIAAGALVGTTMRGD